MEERTAKTWRSKPNKENRSPCLNKFLCPAGKEKNKNHTVMLIQLLISVNGLVNIKLANSEKHLKCILHEEAHIGAQIFKFGIFVRLFL